MTSEKQNNEKMPQDGADINDIIRTHTDIEDGNVIEKHNNSDADPALDFIGGEEVVFTPEEEKSVLRKIDWALMPLLCWVYALQFPDKTSLNYASLMGIREDTHLNALSQEYSWASSIFYAGYILWE
ncbi:hypothetical protein G7046_g6519 [Stylonectria norvegica]|nr:hypothetical protein G7046_g6519 [Stylonectria norvegica]